MSRLERVCRPGAAAREGVSEERSPRGRVSENLLREAPQMVCFLWAEQQTTENEDLGTYNKPREKGATTTHYI